MKCRALVATVLLAVSALAQPDSIRFSSDSSYPSVISKVKPEYTEQAKKAGIEGEAVLAVTIDENGLPKDPEFVRFQQGPKQIQDSLGLDKMAVTAVKLWRFRAAMKGGKPTSMRVKVEVQFRLSQRY
jgi:protein TonB